MDDHDSGYRQLFSHPEMVRDLLTGFVAQDWVALLDMDSLEKVSGNYVTDDLRSRCDDVVWRVRCGPQWIYVYLLLEFQSTVDPYMAVRIMAYVALLYQDLIRTGQLEAGGLLPPVLPLVLYNGSRRWQAATEVAELIHPVTHQLAAYRPAMRYLLLDEGTFQEHELAPLRNLVAALFRLENSREAADVQQVLRLLIDWLHSQQQAGLRRSFTEWLRRVLLPARLPGVPIPAMQALQEVDDMLAERVQQWYREYEERGLAKGMEKGRQEGLVEGRSAEARLILSRLLARRFGEMAPEILEHIQSADIDTLEKWTDRVLDATTPEDIFR
ncbi:transposase [Isoalcanivorax pacificus W11-5]|uniref:Transposase n=1 Tax=Isoalcanivorax pacificus W11-5 TaxID=391936 RepID=A0A0B4XMC6_9GAMM|nr:Rpn family recombination-promoting nuclease/putative transposase [Isoalcanivorax pacificus]AJD47472.1 transposase [Isoalcanivorax pacificus W11-5]